MNESPASRAANAAETALVAFVASLAFIVYQATEAEQVRPFMMTLGSLALVVSGVLHLFFVALLARRLERNPTWYVIGALVTLPIGSAVGLVLYEWFTKSDRPGASTTAI